MPDEKVFSESFQPDQSSQCLQCSHDDPLGIEEQATDPDEEAIAEALATCEQAIAICKDDPGALASEEFVKAFAYLKRHDAEEAFRIRAKLKRDKPSGILLSDIEKRVNEELGGTSTEEPQIADRLIELALELGDLSHDLERKCYFTTKAMPRKTFRIDLKEFKDYLGYAFYMRTREERGTTGIAASDNAFKSATIALSGIALHEGPEEKVWLRVAQHGNGYIIDLGNEQRHAVEVMPTGWRLLDEAPVKFLLHTSMGALPIPTREGNLEDMWRFCNIPETERPLVQAWILESFRPNTPFPVLGLCGRQGCAKSSTQKNLRRLIDPNAVNLRAAPKCVEDVFVSAGVNWLASYENISHLSSAMQDALCTLATGGGYASRTLFTNADETIIEAKRPIIINSIPPVVTAQDLMDRVLHVELPPLQEYAEDEQVETEFNAAAPGLFGALLDLMTGTLATLPKVTWHDRSIRMVDFAKLGEAMMVSQGKDHGEFSRLFAENRQDSVARGLEASPVALAIRDLVDTYTGTNRTVFYGTMKELLKRLADFKPDSESWPRSPRGLGDAIRRQLPALASVDIDIKIGKPGRAGVPVEIRKCEHVNMGEHRFSWKSPEEKKSRAEGDRI